MWEGANKDMKTNSDMFKVLADVKLDDRMMIGK